MLEAVLQIARVAKILAALSVLACLLAAQPSLSAFAANEESGFVRTGGVEIFWRWLDPAPGIPARGAIAHFTGTTDSCDRNLPTHRAFAALGFAVFCHDHRGQGRSTRLGASRPVVHTDSFMRYVTDADAVLEAAFVPRAKARGLKRYLASTSMGGAVAFLYVEERPEAFAAHASTVPMLGINTGPGPDWVVYGAMRIQCLLGACDRYMLGLGSTAPRGFEGNNMTSDARAWNEMEAFYAQNPDLRFGGTSAGWVSEAIRATWTLAAVRAPKPVPTLILQAESDTIVLAAPQESFCARNPNCRIVRVPAARHGLFEEKKEASALVRASIAAFYASVSAPAHSARAVRAQAPEPLRAETHALGGAL